MAKKTKSRKPMEKSYSQVLWLMIVATTLGLTFLRSAPNTPSFDRTPASAIAPTAKTR